uniref:Uncharacterized protein n=1 Tax=Arundo donax TaxID=35708 RepID=A0A0A8YKA7_ARUDO
MMMLKQKTGMVHSLCSL